MTLVEILVALAVTSFLMIGLFTIVQTTLQASTNQNALSQLQDNERLAMQRIADVVEHAGYFYAPALNTATGTLSADATQGFVAGQAVLGTHVAGPPQDTITVRYYANGTGTTPDNLINCDGSQVAGAGLYYNKFFVSGGNLQCTLITVIGGATSPAKTVTLVSNVQDMVISYGTSSTATCAASYSSSTNPVDTYYSATTMPAAGWCGVISVQVALVFANPLYNATGPVSQQYPNQLPFVQLTRLINVMSRI